jgi:hypothetical protein
MALVGAAAWDYWFTMPLFPAISAPSLAFAAVATVTAIGGLGAAIGALFSRFWWGMFWGAAVASVGVTVAAAIWAAF